MSSLRSVLSHTAFGAVVVLSGGCGAVATDQFEICALDVSFTVASGAPGAEIEVSGHPLTEVRDTRVEVSGVRATVVAVERGESCTICDDCRTVALCPPCGFCLGERLPDEVDPVTCFGDALADPPILGDCDTCVESLTFVVPDVAPGLTSVLVVNRNGQSEALAFEVLPAGADTAADTGSVP